MIRFLVASILLSSSLVSAQTAATRRSRSLELDGAIFNKKAAKEIQKQKRPARMRVGLFADRALDVVFDNVQPDGRNTMIWTGKLAGNAVSSAVFVVTDGRITGNISTGDGLLYQIRPNADGSNVVHEVDTRTFPRELEPKVPSAAQMPAVPDVAPGDGSDGNTIDVLVVYTAAARAAAGGEAEMRQLIQLGIAETNQGYANSGLSQRVRLAGSGELNYQESGDLSTDLDRLTATNDGYMDEIHPVRDRAGADLVSLWVESGGGCGIGWLLANPQRPNPQLGFNVVRRDCATGYFSFGHEMGHNMGAMHAKDDQGGEGAFPYSFGYKHTSSSPFFRCIMSYNCAGTGCDRVNLWSSPEVRFRGIALGDSSTDNRLTLMRTAEIVAAYRKSTQGNTPPPSNSSKYPESTHPYVDSFDQTWKYTHPGSPSAIYVTFDANTYVEVDYDYIVVGDGTGKQVEGSPFTGEQLAGRTLRIPGDTVQIRLLTDESVNDYGFAVSNVTAANGASVDLVAVSLSAPRSAVVGGYMEGVVSVIRNDGSAPSGAFRIGYYFVSASSDVTFSGWSCQVPDLAPGARYTCGGGIGVPSSLTPGNYVLGVFADDLYQTGDSKMENNLRPADSGVVQLRAQ